MTKNLYAHRVSERVLYRTRIYKFSNRSGTYSLPSIITIDIFFVLLCFLSFIIIFIYIYYSIYVYKFKNFLRPSPNINIARGGLLSVHY